VLMSQTLIQIAILIHSKQHIDHSLEHGKVQNISKSDSN
jgi:hypothetical protein